jgi:hypothetical protein
MRHVPVPGEINCKKPRIASKPAALEMGTGKFGVREAAWDEPAIRKARVAKDRIGKLNPLKHAIGERRALAIQLGPAIVWYPQGGYRLAGADLLGERADGHASRLWGLVRTRHLSLIEPSRQLRGPRHPWSCRHFGRSFGGIAVTSGG